MKYNFSDKKNTEGISHQETGTKKRLKGDLYSESKCYQIEAHRWRN